MNDLYNAPPRLSDLRGDDLTAALHARAVEHKRNWLESRQHRGLFVRIVERLQGGAA